MIHVEKTKEIEVVLDSGADISLAPLWMKKVWEKSPRGEPELFSETRKEVRSRFQIKGIIQVEFEDVSGNKVKVEEIFYDLISCASVACSRETS